MLSAAFARYQPGLLFPHTQGPDASKADPLTLQVALTHRLTPTLTDTTLQPQVTLTDITPTLQPWCYQESP